MNHHGTMAGQAAGAALVAGAVLAVVVALAVALGAGARRAHGARHRRVRVLAAAAGSFAWAAWDLAIARSASAGT